MKNDEVQFVIELKLGGNALKTLLLWPLDLCDKACRLGFTGFR